MTLEIEALGREHYNATVEQIRRVHDGLFVLRVRPDAAKPAHEAGQWLLMGIGLWEPRCDGCPPDDLKAADSRTLKKNPFSLSGTILAADEDRLLEPAEEPWYGFYQSFDCAQAVGTSGAALSARLFATEAGARLWVDDAPRGSYTLRGVEPEQDVLFLATGTGEAPHNRMVAELLRRGHRGRITSAVTVRQKRDLAYADVHARLARLFDNYRYAFVATRDASAPGQRLQAMLESGALEEAAAIRLEPSSCHVFLCGNWGMVGRPRTENDRSVYPEPPGMIELLERRGLSVEPPEDAHIHFERY
jgi:ferredoxin--NADP+ reductase